MISGILLAAGESRRMGVQKLLLPYGGKTMIEHIVDEALQSTLDEIVVVTGHEAEAVTDQIRDRAVRIVFNADYQRGMLSSVRSGLSAVTPNSQGIMVLLGDHPTVSSGLIDALIQFFKKNKAGIVVPSHAGARGHPILFSAVYRTELQTRYEDAGLRGLLAAHPDALAEMPVENPDILTDIDLPEDYQRALESLPTTKSS